MNIVINALQYRSEGSGIAVNLRELFSRFTEITDHPCKIIVPRGVPAFPCSSDTEIIVAPCTYEEGIRRIFFQSFQLGRKYAKNSVLLMMDSKVPLLLPQSCRVISIITDLALFRLPETYQKSRVLLWRMQFFYLRRRAHFFLAISEFTKKEMIEILHIPEERIKVIPCAADKAICEVKGKATIEKVRRKYGLPDQYILFVGNLNPRKNLTRLIRAFDRLKNETDLPHQLVIAGGSGWKLKADEVLNDVSNRQSVCMIGYVSDEDISALYSAASLFAFPTLYEGFGIPVLEAQQCGVPVLTSNISALPEITADSAFLVNPYDEEEIAQGMREVLLNQSLREQLIEKGYRNAERFSWDDSAKLLEKAVKETI